MKCHSFTNIKQKLQQYHARKPIYQNQSRLSPFMAYHQNNQHHRIHDKTNNNSNCLYQHSKFQHREGTYHCEICSRLKKVCPYIQYDYNKVKVRTQQGNNRYHSQNHNNFQQRKTRIPFQKSQTNQSKRPMSVNNSESSYLNQKKHSLNNNKGTPSFCQNEQIPRHKNQGISNFQKNRRLPTEVFEQIIFYPIIHNKLYYIDKPTNKLKLNTSNVENSAGKSFSHGYNAKRMQNKKIYHSFRRQKFDSFRKDNKQQQQDKHRKKINISSFLGSTIPDQPLTPQQLRLMTQSMLNQD